MTIELELALWGAGVSSGLAGIKLYEFISNRPRLTVGADPSFTLTQEDAETYGVKLQLRQGPDLAWNEALIRFAVANSGNQSMQVVCAYVEMENQLIQITPPNLPVILQPNMQATVEIQPEFFHGKPLSAGVYDALGKQHCVPKKRFSQLVAEIQQWPLRVGTFIHKETGNVVKAYQMHMRDKVEFISKRKA